MSQIKEQRSMEYDLSRFVHMHKENYEMALAEIRS